MPYLAVEPPPFFRRGPSPLARLAFFGCISIALLFVDTRYHYLEGLRHVAAIVLYPLQRAVQMPGEGLGWIGSYFVSLRELSEDNETLKRQSVEHAAAAQSFAATQCGVAHRVSQPGFRTLGRRQQAFQSGLHRLGDL